MFSFRVPSEPPANEYDFLAIVEDFVSHPSMPNMSRANKRDHKLGHWKLKKRNYRHNFHFLDNPPCFHSGSATPPHQVDLNSCNEVTTSASIFPPSSENGLLTPPSTYGTLFSDFKHPTGSKRRKTEPKAESHKSEHKLDRHQLVLQMQLSRPSTDDEEASVWSASDDEYNSDDNGDEDSGIICENKIFPLQKVCETRNRRRV